MKKYGIIIIVVYICAFIGIVKVNVEYNKINGKAYDEEVYKNIYEEDGKRPTAFGEMVVNREKSVRIRMYYTAKPFDLRFAVGNKVLYINGSIFDDLKEKIYVKREEKE